MAIFPLSTAILARYFRRYRVNKFYLDVNLTGHAIQVMDKFTFYVLNASDYDACGTRFSTPCYIRKHITVKNA